VPLRLPGNELTDLNRLPDTSHYLPCTLPLPNVLCVTATAPSDALFTGVVGNKNVGLRGRGSGGASERRAKPPLSHKPSRDALTHSCERTLIRCIVCG
jgi:hypothetical protein